MKKTILLLTAAIGLFAFAPIAESIWKLDKAHSNLKFVITHMMISDVEGSFKNVDATITAAKEDFSDAVVELTADVNSISTDNERRDNHLKSPDFFDAAKYPSLVFKSTSFEKVGDKVFKVKGPLTLHGVTKDVELEVTHRATIEHPKNKKKIAGFKVTGSIKRSDFGIGSNNPPGMLSDEVGISANAEFIMQ
jgi:polyisoprenoid-binding protein YceI